MKGSRAGHTTFSEFEVHSYEIALELLGFVTVVCAVLHWLHFAALFAVLMIAVCSHWLITYINRLRVDSEVLQELRGHADMNALQRVNRAAVCNPTYEGDIRQLYQNALVMLSVTAGKEYGAAKKELEKKIIKAARRSLVVQNARLHILWTKRMEECAADPNKQRQPLNGELKAVVDRYSANRALLKDIAELVPEERENILITLRDGGLPPAAPPAGRKDEKAKTEAIPLLPSEKDDAVNFRSAILLSAPNFA